jgi:hypothetical protein
MAVAPPTKRRADPMAAAAPPTNSNQSGSPPASLARCHLHIGAKEQIPKMKGVGPSTVSESTKKKRLIFQIPLLHPDSTKMFYGTTGVTISIWRIVEKQLTNFCHMFSQIVVWFVCKYSSISITPTNMQTNIFYLMEVIPNICSDLKAPIYPIAENILFCLMFSQIMVWLEK